MARLPHPASRPRHGPQHGALRSVLEVPPYPKPPLPNVSQGAARATEGRSALSPPILIDLPIYLLRKGTYRWANVSDTVAFVDPRFPERIVLVDPPDHQTDRIRFYRMINHESLHVALSRVMRTKKERKLANLGLDEFIEKRRNRCLIDPSEEAWLYFLGLAA